jgi:RNA-binding protein
MQPMTTTQRQYLRKRAHHLKPIVQIGKSGLSDEVLATVGRELAAHELIKIKFLEFQDQKRELAEQIVETTGSQLVGLIGNMAILYRQQPDPEKRRIHLPH